LSAAEASIKQENKLRNISQDRILQNENAQEEGLAGRMMRKVLTREFILLFLAQFTFSFVFQSLIPTLPIYLSRSGCNEVEIGVLVGVFFFCALVLRPFVGKALLKTPEKKFMIAGALFFALSSFAYLIALPFWPLLVVRVFQGIGFAFFHTAAFTLVANISPEAHRGQSLSYFALAMSISGALGPTAGILLINHFTFDILFLACSGLSFCSLFITFRLGTRQAIPLQNSSIDDGSLLSLRALPPSVINALSLFVWGAVTAFFPLYAISRGVDNPGLFFTTMAIMLILGRALGGKILDVYRREKVILPCLLIYILSMVLLTFSQNLPMFILVAAIWGIGNAFLAPALIADALDRVGSSAGPAMGTFTAISDLGLTAGPVIMGIILQSTSYPVMFLCLAFTGVINLCYFHFSGWEKASTDLPRKFRRQG
jgi:MFS family permease